MTAIRGHTRQFKVGTYVATVTMPTPALWATSTAVVELDPAPPMPWSPELQAAIQGPLQRALDALARDLSGDPPTFKLTSRLGVELVAQITH